MSSKNVGKPLTMDLIFTKTKSDSLINIKNLNLWGNDLEDLQLLEKMPNLEVVSLSVNRISTLKDFAKCSRIQELYLRKNNISDINEIRYLMKLPTLKVLWLHDNPCSLVPNYRQIVIKNLPHLMKLDNNPVVAEDRVAAENKIKKPLDPYDPNEENKDSEKYERQHQQKHQKYEPKQGKNDQKIYKQQNKLQHKQEQKWSNNRNSQRKQQVKSGQEMSRNQNILMAMLSLMRQLDQGSLEIIRREAENMLTN